MLVAKNITKKFGGVLALSDVSLELHPGKVNAIIGENGAGKSTLMKIFSGVYPQYEGTIFLNDTRVKFQNTKEAEAAGISIIHQELNLVPYLSIAENIFLGREITNAWGVLDNRQMKEKAEWVLAKVNLAVKADTLVAALKVGEQQLVEIAKALLINAEVIIMDEPTSAISDKEVSNLFTIISQLKAEGKTIVYISHKLNELLTIADRFVVLRDGTSIDEGDMKNVTAKELIQKMTGRVLNFEKTGKTKIEREEVLTVRNVHLKHSSRKFVNILTDISLTVHKSEILGIYGLMGAGRTELMECIFGLHPKTSSGDIIMNGKPIKINTPSEAIAAGIALVPEDRKKDGLILNQSIKSNITLTVMNQIEKWNLVLSRTLENALTADYIKKLSIKTSSVDIAARALSGGNQQKIVLAKWLATNPQILLLDEPTRGIDINAKSEIYKLMKTLANEGMGIIMVSSELPEILAVSDRILVMCEGELTASMPIEEATETNILKYAIQKNITAA
jgi:ribose transport system ATP-binding protein